MKKIIALAIVATSLLLFGQTGSPKDPPAPTPPPHPQAQSKSRGDDLNLTDQQKSQVQAIFQEMQQKIQAAVQEARTNADAQLQKALTPDQYQKLQNMFHEQQRLEQDRGRGTNTTENPQR